MLTAIVNISCLFNDAKCGESGSLPLQGALLWLMWPSNRAIEAHANH
jgi:hypothetical protein